MKSKTSKKPPGVRLNRPQDVRRLLSRLINQTLAGELEVDMLRGITYASSMILKSLELGEFEERLQKIEENLGVKK